MKTYEIHIKSHCEAPDYEDQVDAETKDEAMDLFLKRGLQEWDKKMIEDCVGEVNQPQTEEEFLEAVSDETLGIKRECEKCGEETQTKFIGDESYNYCKSCNWTTN